MLRNIASAVLQGFLAGLRGRRGAGLAVGDSIDWFHLGDFAPPNPLRKISTGGDRD